MKAILKTERTYGGIRVENVPPPIPKENEVLVRIRRASVCGSDLHAYCFSPSHHYLQPPVIMGHECAGEVLDVGAAVSDYKPGDRVAIEAVVYCGKCPACFSGQRHLCEHLRIRGMHQNGVFAEQVAVNPNDLHKIPKTLSFDKACLVEPVAVAVHAVLDQSDIRPGDIVLVTGPGPIGLLAAQLIKGIGAEPVVAGIDSDETVRLPIARELGIPAVNVQRQSLTEFLKQIYGREAADGMVECSGSPSAVQTGLEVVAKGGRITLVGLFSKTAQIDLTLAVRKEITLSPSCIYRWDNFERAITLLDQGKIVTEKLVSYYKPEEAVNAFEDAMAKKVPKPVFVF